MRWIILCFPLPLLAQIPLDPWSVWHTSSPTCQVFAEQSGPKPGWHALGAQWIRPQWAIHGLWGPAGFPSCVLFAHIDPSPHYSMLLGWGLEHGQFALYAQAICPFPASRNGQLRLHWSPNRGLEAAASVSQWTEWGWHVGLTAVASMTQGIEFVVHARPDRHPHFRGIYATTSGRWRVEWVSGRWSVLLGAGPYAYSRWALHPVSLP